MSLDVRQYNAVEQWCRKKVASGAEFLFDPVLFHDALYKASKEFDFPFEVRSHMWESVLLCIIHSFNILVIVPSFLLSQHSPFARAKDVASSERQNWSNRTRLYKRNIDCKLSAFKQLSSLSILSYSCGAHCKSGGWQAGTYRFHAGSCQATWRC